LLPEIRQGIQGTEIKAGIIKCGTGELGVTDPEQTEEIENKWIVVNS